MAKLSVLRTGHLYFTGDILPTHFCQSLGRLYGNSATRKIKSVGNFNDPIRDQNRDLPAHSTSSNFLEESEANRE